MNTHSHTIFVSLDSHIIAKLGHRRSTIESQMRQKSKNRVARSPIYVQSEW